MVISDGQERVLEALEQKTNKAIELYANLVANANRDFAHVTKDFNQSSSAAGVSAMKTKDQIITKTTPSITRTAWKFCRRCLITRWICQFTHPILRAVSVFQRPARHVKL